MYFTVLNKYMQTNKFVNRWEWFTDVSAQEHGLLNNPDVRLPFHGEIWRGRLFHFQTNQNWKELFQYFFLSVKAILNDFTNNGKCFQKSMIKGKIGLSPSKGQNRISFK